MAGEVSDDDGVTDRSASSFFNTATRGTEAFALSSLIDIDISPLVRGASDFVLCLGTMDRLGSGGRADWAVVPDERLLADTREEGPGTGAPMEVGALRYRTLSHAGSDSGILRAFNARRACRAMVVRSGSVSLGHS